MSQGYTTSMSKGRTAPYHALRDEEYTRKEKAKGRLKNVDISKTKYNEILRDMGGKSLEETFNETFAEDVEKHNLHQNEVGHPERKIHNYFKKIKKDYNNAKDKRRALKTDYEYVIQFGGQETGVPAEAVEMLKFVYEILLKQEQAGNWHINYAAIHVDEASPHMHINMTPIARGYKKGMPARPALNKATKQWLESANINVNRNFAYQHLLSFIKDGVMVNALESRGYERIVMNCERAHSTVEEYKAKKKIENEIKEKEQVLDDLKVKYERLRITSRKEMTSLQKQEIQNLKIKLAKSKAKSQNVSLNWSNEQRLQTKLKDLKSENQDLYKQLNESITSKINETGLRGNYLSEVLNKFQLQPNNEIHT